MAELTLEERVAKLEKRVRETATLWRWRFIYPLAAVFASMFLALGTNIWYTTNSVNVSNQTWCELVGSLDDQNQATPPPADNIRAVTFANQIHHIRVKFKCQ